MEPVYRITDHGREGVFLARIEGEEGWFMRIGAIHAHCPTSGAIRWARYLIEADRAGDLSLKQLGTHALLTDECDVRAQPFIQRPGGESDD